MSGGIQGKKEITKSSAYSHKEALLYSKYKNKQVTTSNIFWRGIETGRQVIFTKL